MIPEIIENFDFFSNLTQRTLSAFHVSGTDDTLVIDINTIKKYAHGPLYKTVKNVIREDSNYKRIFSDGTSDVVTESELLDPVPIDDVEVEILKTLKKPYNPITHIKYGTDIILAHHKVPTLPNERLFFIDTLDCIDYLDSQ